MKNPEIPDLGRGSPTLILALLPPVKNISRFSLEKSSSLLTGLLACGPGAGIRTGGGAGIPVGGTGRFGMTVSVWGAKVRTGGGTGIPVGGTGRFGMTVSAGGNGDGVIRGMLSVGVDGLTADVFSRLNGFGIAGSAIGVCASSDGSGGGTPLDGRT